jgi:hypothetical protein
MFCFYTVFSCFLLSISFNNRHFITHIHLSHALSLHGLLLPFVFISCHFITSIYLFHFLPLHSLLLASPSVLLYQSSFHHPHQSLTCPVSTQSSYLFSFRSPLSRHFTTSIHLFHVCLYTVLSCLLLPFSYDSSFHHPHQSLSCPVSTQSSYLFSFRSPLSRHFTTSIHLFHVLSLHSLVMPSSSFLLYDTSFHHAHQSLSCPVSTQSSYLFSFHSPLSRHFTSSIHLFHVLSLHSLLISYPSIQLFESSFHYSHPSLSCPASTVFSCFLLPFSSMNRHFITRIHLFLKL